MLLKDGLIKEFQQETANTRKMLERVPAEHFGWQPHEKSMTLGRLAVHVAELSGWITMTINQDELDFAKWDYKPLQPTTTDDILKLHDKNVEEALIALNNVSEEDLMKMWTLRRGDHVILELPKAGILRGMCNNHLYHHRGQLSVYLRLLDVPIPGLYGPSADDRIAMAANN